MTDHIETIKTLNDSFRRSFVGGKVVMTRSVACLSSADKFKVAEAVRNYDDFKDESETDDYERPDEHDMGFFELDGVNYMFKIDYYDASMEFGSDNPADASVTTRVLTIMESRDY